MVNLCRSVNDKFQISFETSQVNLTGNVMVEKLQRKREEERDHPVLDNGLSTCMPCYAKSLQACPTLCDPQTAAYQAPPSLGFSRQEHWSGLPFPSPMHASEK